MQVAIQKGLKKTQYKIYLWKKKTNMNDLKNLTSKVVSELLTQIDTKTTVNQWRIKLRDGINKIIEDNVPSKMTKSKFTNPWANKNIDKLCKQQRKAFNKAKRPVNKNIKINIKKLKLQHKEKLEEPKVIICKK